MGKLTNKRLVLFIYLALALTTFAVFWQVRNHEFLNFDDHMYVSQNPQVTGRLTPQSVLWAFTTPHGSVSYWHPLTSMSHILDCQLFGTNPGGHHLTSLLLHVANTLLLFSVFRWMTGALWPSAFVAAAFALHPLHVESVAWISERKDVLCTLFWMLTLGAYLRYVRHPGTGRYLLTLLAFALGLMAKPMIVTLPFVLLLLDYWPLGRFQSGQAVKDADKPDHEPANIRSQSLVFFRLVWEKVPFFILSAIISVVTFVIQHKLGAVGSIGQLPPKLRILNALISYVTYIGKMAWPSRLAVFYPYPLTVPVWQAAAAAFVLLVISLSIASFARDHKYLLIGWLWYLGTLVPVIGLVQAGEQALADRYTYIPLIGPFIIIAWGFPDALIKWRYRKIALGISAATVLSALTVCTSLQLQYWRNDITLFGHALNVTADNHIAHNNLAAAMSEQGRFEEAVPHFFEAVRLEPGFIEARSNLAAALFYQGKLDESITHFTEALRQQPDNAGVHYNLANALAAKGKSDEAVAHYTEALRLKPNQAKVHYNLANVLLKQGRIDQAIIHWTEALRLEPQQPDVYNILGSLFSRQGKTAQAITHYTGALRLRPHWPEALNNLAWLFATHREAEFRNPAEAIRLAERACDLTGYRHPVALDTLAAAYAAAGKFPRAVETAEKAVELANSAGKKDLAQEIQGRIQLYKTRQPYRAPARDDSGS